MNLLAKIYIIFQISRRHSFMNYLIPAPKVRSYYSLFCRKEGKKLLSCPKLAPFFAGGGLSRQWKKSRLFCNMWSYEVIFVRNFLPSSLNYFFVKRLSGKKCALQKQRWLFKVWLSFWLMTRQLSWDHLASIRPTSTQQHDFCQRFKRKDNQTQLLYYVSLIRACLNFNQFDHQLVYMGPRICVV